MPTHEERSQECGEYAEAVLKAVQGVVERHDNVMNLNPVLFALASVQALFIGGIEDTESREFLVAQTNGMLAYSVESQRKFGLFDRPERKAG